MMGILWEWCCICPAYVMIPNVTEKWSREIEQMKVAEGGGCEKFLLPKCGCKNLVMNECGHRITGCIYHGKNSQ